MKSLSLSIFSMLVVAVLLMLPAIGIATTDTIGFTNGTDTGDSTIMFSNRICASASGTLQTLGYNVQTGAGNITLGLYSETGGSPSTLLAKTNNVAAISGWNDIAANQSISIVSGTCYWIANQQSSNSLVLYSVNIADIWFLYNPDGWSYGVMPDHWNNGVNATGTRNMRITYLTDSTPPTWSSNSTNATTGQLSGFNILWTDETGLSGYIFGFDNGTGSYTNSTFAALGSNPAWANVTKMTNSTCPNTFRWLWYANDSSNNWNTSYAFSFTNSTCTAPLGTPAGNTSYEYYCINGFSFQNKTTGGNSTITKLQCQFGCYNSSQINYAQNRDPQGDLCQPVDNFYMNYIIIGGFIGIWMFIILWYKMSKILPFFIRFFIWIMLFIALMYLGFVNPYPVNFTANQVQMLQILTLISVLGVLALTIHVAASG